MLMPTRRGISRRHGHRRLQQTFPTWPSLPILPFVPLKQAIAHDFENPAFFFSQSATQRVLMDKSGGSRSSQGASPRRFLRHHLPFAEA